MYNLRQVAEKLGVSVYTMRYWVKEGKISTARTLGGHHRITQETLVWLEKQFMEHYRKSAGRGE